LCNLSTGQSLATASVFTYGNLFWQNVKISSRQAAFFAFWNSFNSVRSF
jgi:hypothetical protein